MNQEELMQQLIEYAYDKMRNNNAYPFSAFIVKDNKVIGRGYNSKVNDYGDKTMHGEMEAMKAACLELKEGIYLKDCTLFTTCEPCLACFDACLWSGIKSFVCATDHTDFPEYFHDHDYSIEQYIKENPNQIDFHTHVFQEKGVNLFKEAKEKYGW